MHGLEELVFDGAIVGGSDLRGRGRGVVWDGFVAQGEASWTTSHSSRLAWRVDGEQCVQAAARSSRPGRNLRRKHSGQVPWTREACWQ